MMMEKKGGKTRTSQTCQSTLLLVKLDDNKWNVTPLIISLQHFISPALDLMPCLQAQGTGDCNKGINSKKGAIINFWEFFGSKHFFKNCGPYCIKGPN